MSDLTQTQELSQDNSNKMSFQNEDSWMIQCLSLATIGLLAYMHIAPMVYASN